jgi:VanZ family protein
MSFLIPSAEIARPFRRHTKVYWMTAVTGWIAMIGFSCTSLAGSWSERAFHAVSAFLFQQLQLGVGGSPLVHFLAEKSVHVCLFATFAVLLWNTLPNSFRKLGYVILAGTLLGCGSEFLQRFFPGRDPALRDVCINAAATICGAVMSLVVFSSKRKQASTPA